MWSVMIPTYNCAAYLRQTLSSVLAQDPGSEMMQIEVVDDCSTQDNPEEVIKELGGSRVSFYRQPQNVGHTKNFETCLQRSRGKLIHLLHGDDCVRDGFYLKLQQAFDTYPEIGAAFCRHIFMDENSHWQWISSIERADSGILDNWLEKIASHQRIQTPSIAVRREVYEKLGAFDRRLCWSEDWEMWARIAASYPVWYEVEPLAIYRQHSQSNTGKMIRSAENIRDLRRAIVIIKQYVGDANTAEALSNKALKFYGSFALNAAREFARSGDTPAAFNQLKEALLCRPSWSVIRGTLSIVARLSYQRAKKGLRLSEPTILSGENS